MCERVHTHLQTHTCMHAHSMQILVLGGTGPSHIPAGQIRGRHVAILPWHPESQPQAEGGEGPPTPCMGSPTTPLPLPPLEHYDRHFTHSHCVPLKQTSIPAPPRQSKYCRGHVLKGCPHRVLGQRDTKVYRETAWQCTWSRYRDAGRGSVQARSHGGGALR